MILWLAACLGPDPFRNEAPKLISFNGQEIDARGSFVNEVVPLGEDFPLRVVAEDPENGPVRIWFPQSPGWIEFDPDGTDGVWHVPDDPCDFRGWLDIDLEDQHDPPARSRSTIVFPQPETLDSGACS